jgi:hypothetical protein
LQGTHLALRDALSTAPTCCNAFAMSRCHDDARAFYTLVLGLTACPVLHRGLS